MLSHKYARTLIVRLPAFAPFLVATAASASPEPKVDLLADTAGAVPGQTVRLAIRFNIPEDSYIFWQNPGDIGQAPTILWTSPNSDSFGVLRFPAPERLALGGSGWAYVLRYEPVLLSQMTVPIEAAPGTTLQIRGRLDWAEGTPDGVHSHRTPLSLDLPIVSQGSEPEDANEEVFTEAAYSMPEPASRAKHLKLDVESKPAQIVPGASAAAVISVSIKKGFHVQAHDPGAQGLIGLDLFFVPPPGVTVREPEYPKGTSREVKYLGKVHEYVGQVILEAPLNVESTFSGGKLTGLLRYQACDDKTGVCFPPENVSWSLDLEVAK
jgi:DsbC/DsbD-like thiol-disulfide interchange protein